MATDKEIFQLPDITLDILQSGVDISFVAQVEGYNLDFQVPSDVLLQYIGGNYQVGVSGGSTTPDNASGANGDIYFKSNGVVYQKVANSWVIKATLPIKQYFNPTKINLPAGSSYPYTTAIDGTNLENGFDYYAENLLSDTQSESLNDIRIVRNYVDNTRLLISSIDIYGHPGEGGVTTDNIVVTLYGV